MPAMAQMARPSHAAPAGLDRGVLHHAFPSPPGALDFSDQTEHGKVFLMERAVAMVAEIAAEATAYALLVLLGAGRGEEEQDVGATPLAP